MVQFYLKTYWEEFKMDILPENKICQRHNWLISSLITICNIPEFKFWVLSLQSDLHFIRPAVQDSVQRLWQRVAAWLTCDCLRLAPTAAVLLSLSTACLLDESLTQRKEKTFRRFSTIWCLLFLVWHMGLYSSQMTGFLQGKIKIKRTELETTFLTFSLVLCK